MVLNFVGFKVLLASQYPWNIAQARNVHLPFLEYLLRNLSFAWTRVGDVADGPYMQPMRLAQLMTALDPRVRVPTRDMCMGRWASTVVSPLHPLPVALVGRHTLCRPVARGRRLQSRQPRSGDSVLLYQEHIRLGFPR